MREPKKRMKPTLLSRIFVKVFSVLRRFRYSIITLRNPQGGLCAIRYAACGDCGLFINQGSRFGV